jgi:hypothetical protein
MPTLYVNNFLTWVRVQTTWINNSGTWTRVRATWENNNGTWRVIQASFTIDAANCVGSASGFASSGLVSGSISAPIITGNVGSISYSWTHLATGTGVTPNITGASNAAPTWSATVQDNNESFSSWRVTATDTTTGAVATDDITVRLTWTNLS